MQKIKNKKLIIILLTISMAILLNACSKKAPENVVARVNDEEIEEEVFEKEYDVQANLIKKEMGEEVLEQEESDGMKVKDKLKEEILDSLILEEIISQDANEEGIKITEEEIDESIVDMKTSMGGQDQYDEFLEEQGIDEEYIRTFNKKNILLIKHKSNFLENLELKDEETQTFFDENKEDLIMIKARHILLESEEKGELVLKKLKDGEAFEELVNRYSKDTETLANGGELQPFQRGSNPKEFDDAVFELKEGETSALIRSEGGIHIVEVQERKDTFEDLKPGLVKLIEDKEYIDHVEKIQEEAKIETFLEIEGKNKNGKDKE